MTLIKLFISFFKIGLFSFGGGYAMLPMIRSEVIYNNHWITNEEFFDILALSQVTPGPIAINSATFLGYKVSGVFGSIVATFAVILPSLIIVLTLSYLLSKYKDFKAIDWAFKGLRPAVIGLILAAAISIAAETFIDIKSIIIAVVLFYLLTFKKLHPIIGIALAGVVGVIVY